MAKTKKRTAAKKPSPPVQELTEPQAGETPPQEPTEPQKPLEVVAPPLGAGRIIHLNIGTAEQVWRPAIVIDEEWLQAFLRPGDLPYAPGSRLTIGAHGEYLAPIGDEGDKCGQWRWPPRS